MRFPCFFGPLLGCGGCLELLSCVVGKRHRAKTTKRGKGGLSVDTCQSRHTNFLTLWFFSKATCVPHIFRKFDFAQLRGSLPANHRLQAVRMLGLQVGSKRRALIRWQIGGPGRPLNWCLDTSFPEVSWAVKASEGVGRKVHLNNTGHLATCSVLLGPVVPDSCFAGSNRSKRIGHSLLNDDHDGNCKSHVALGRWTNR